MTSAIAPPRTRADKRVAALLRAVHARVQAGQPIVEAFSDEYRPQAGFLRATALFAAKLTVLEPCRVDQLPTDVVGDALDQAIRDAEDVRVRNFADRRYYDRTRAEARR